MRCSSGFTLLEVLVALVIVGVSLGASLRAVGSLTRNSEDVRAAMSATWSAENQMTQFRLQHAWPAIGTYTSECPQGNLRFICTASVSATPNPMFRRVEVEVFDAPGAQRRIAVLNQVLVRGG